MIQDSLKGALRDQLAELRRKADELAVLVESVPMPAAIAARTLLDLEAASTTVWKHSLALIDARDSRREDLASESST